LEDGRVCRQDAYSSGGYKEMKNEKKRQSGKIWQARTEHDDKLLEKAFEAYRATGLKQNRT
jgi:hypothetical protein